MNNLVLLKIIFLFSFLLACQANKETASSYFFGQVVPDKVPLLFAPDIISKSDRHEFGCTLSKDGKEFYFGVDNNGRAEIYRTILKDGNWSAQENIFPNDSFSNNDPMFSLDEQRLYFISNRPLTAGGSSKDVDIWYLERTKTGWSSPINAGLPINSKLDEYYISFANNGSMYFAAKDTSKDAPRYAFDIYKSVLENKRYVSRQKLPEEINTKRYEADVFIAPDESYIIFCSIRRNGLGKGDLYISFKDADGHWQEAISMGDLINTEHHELCPYVSKDGQYLFYTSNQDIYWVSAKVIEDLKLQ